MLTAAEAEQREVVNETWEDYMFNWVLWQVAEFKLLICNYISLVGLLFWDDNGAMAERCFKTAYVGGRVHFKGFHTL